MRRDVRLNWLPWWSRSSWIEHPSCITLRASPALPAWTHDTHDAPFERALASTFEGRSRSVQVLAREEAGRLDSGAELEDRVDSPADRREPRAHDAARP